MFGFKIINAIRLEKIKYNVDGYRELEQLRLYLLNFEMHFKEIEL